MGMQHGLPTEFVYEYRHGDETRRGERCRVVARGGWNVTVEFEDGERARVNRAQVRNRASAT